MTRRGSAPPPFELLPAHGRFTFAVVRRSAFAMTIVSVPCILVSVCDSLGCAHGVAVTPRKALRPQPIGSDNARLLFCTMVTSHTGEAVLALFSAPLLSVPLVRRLTRGQKVPEVA